MKTVELTNGKMAIPIHIKHFLTHDLLVTVVTDLVFHKDLDLTESKSLIIKRVRQHLRYQGQTHYNYWYEDTKYTPIINELYKTIEPFIKKMFPELHTTNKG